MTYLANARKKLNTNRRPATAGMRAACEPLEGRRLLTTLVGYSYDGFAAITGVSPSATGSSAPVTGTKVVVPFDYGGQYSTGSVSVTLSDLPAHSMVRVDVSGAGPDSVFESTTSSDTSDGYTVAYAGQTYAYTQGYGTGYDSPWPSELRTETGRIDQWLQHGSGTLTVTLSAVGLESGEYIFFDNLNVSVYQPEVTITGGGTSSEDAIDPTTITVDRDPPSGYAGTLYGDDAIPDTVVNLSRDGSTATSVIDYTSDLPTPSSTPTPTLTTKLENSAMSNTFSVTPIWDDVAESDETITLTANSGTGYTPGGGNTGTVTLQNKAPDAYQASSATANAAKGGTSSWINVTLASANAKIPQFEVVITKNGQPVQNVVAEIEYTRVGNNVTVSRFRFVVDSSAASGDYVATIRPANASNKTASTTVTLTVP